MITLERFQSDEMVTLGHLLDENSEILCYTLELPWLNNQHEISCIPLGIYNVEPYSSPLHPDVLHVLNVPDRTAILIHPGNTVADVRGCICVGDSLGTIHGVQAVLNSQKTFAMLKEKLPDSFELN